ncbi:hypothetical protein [Actinopolymorpha sp. B9G3]|uniref:hypothetical protein n=1 Tax=Actinopolymorpha sp. B9G3 TaxID=3158970 RepID=UPI0032D91712
MADSAEERLAELRGEKAPKEPPATMAQGAANDPAMPTSLPAEQIPLDARAVVGGQQLGFGCLLALGFMLVFFIGLISILVLVFSAVERDIVAVVVGLFFLGMSVGVAVALAKWIRRCRTWLRGTVLVARGPFGTSRCDLATSAVSVDSAAETRTVSTHGPHGTSSTTVRTGRRIPFLVLREATTGKVVRLMLRGRGGRLLPPDQLRLVAAAISTGPRPQPYDQQAQQIAAGLRALADDPFSGHL